MHLLDQLVDRRAEITEAMTVICDTAAEETRDISDTEDQNLKDLASESETLDARITELRDIQVRNLEAARLRAEVSTPGDTADEAVTVRVGREPLTYEEGSKQSFFTDLFQMQFRHDPGASARIGRHTAEMDVEHRDVGTGAFAGLVVPQYLVDLAAELARAGQPFANECTRLPLPSSGMTINISRVTTGSTAAVQATENSAVSEQDMDDTLLTSDVRTIAGQQDVSRQAIERGDGIDALIMADLSAAHATVKDTQLISGTGSSGELLGIGNIPGIAQVAYTDGTPTVAEFYPKVIDAIQRINSNRYAGADLVLLHPRRAAWLAAAVDSQNRPLVLPVANVPQNAMGVGPTAGYGSFGLQIAGIPVVTDANITTTAGAGSDEDIVYVVRRADMLLFEQGDGAPAQIRMEQTLGGSLTIKMVVYSYVGFVGGRYPAAISTVYGTGLVAPSF